MSATDDPTTGSGPLCPSARGALAALSEWLAVRGYSPTTARHYMRAAGHLLRWLWQEHRGIRSATQKAVKDFLFVHLPTCRCRNAGPRDVRSVQAAVGHLLQVAIPGRDPRRVRARRPSRIDRELRNYRAYLLRTCGLAESTCRCRLLYVGQFLRDVGVRIRHNRAHIDPDALIRYVTGGGTLAGRTTARRVGDCVRSYLRWLALRRLVEPDIVNLIPVLRQYRLAKVPRTLSNKQLGELLRSFDRRTATGRRDLAMVLCMAEMGLRVSEVAMLRITDIDWSQGTLRVPAVKCRRSRVLPLSGRPAQAIGDYLQRGRPATQHPFVFVRHTVPRGIPISPGLICARINRAYARLGFPPTCRGTHLLRHTAATLMHQRGATLKQVADVLGHLSIDSTRIYTKVDLPSLREVALPWPEVQP